MIHNTKPISFFWVVFAQLTKSTLFFCLMSQVWWFMDWFLKLNKLLKVFDFVGFYFVGLGCWGALLFLLLCFFRHFCYSGHSFVKN